MEYQACSYWVELARFGLPATLVIVGWIVVNNLAVKRERDKSRREMVTKSADGLCESVDKILEDANEYHSSNRNKQLEIVIKIKLGDLSQRLASLMSITQETNILTNCLNAMVKLRQAITSKHFEDEHISVPSDTLIHEEIADAALAMKRNLVDLKHSQFPLKNSFCLSFKCHR